MYKNIRSIDKNSSINTNPPSQSQCNEQELSLLISTASTQAKRSVRISSNGGGGGGDASLRLNGSIGEQFSSSREARLSTISLEPPSQTFTTTALDVSQNNTASNNLNNPSTVNLNSSQHSSASTPPSSTANNNHNNHSGKNHHHHHHHHTNSFTSCQQIPAPSMEKMRNMAITIIGVTILFIVFTVPINIYIPLMHQAEKDSATTGVKKKCEDLIFCVLNNMVNANHSTSFFIYLITNSKFKNEINNIWKQLKIYFGKSLIV